MYSLPRYNIEIDGKIYECRIGVEHKDFLNTTIIATIYAPMEDPHWQEIFVESMVMYNGGWVFENKMVAQDIKNLQPDLDKFLKEFISS